MGRVNAALAADVQTGPDNAMYLTCSMSALAQNGNDGEASFTRRPLVLTHNWLVVEDNEENYCGGAHPNTEVSYATWDLKTGLRVNLYDWFTPTFRKLIDAAFPASDADCRDAERVEDDWMVRLTTTGVAFTPVFSHVDMACTDDAAIPFARLAPYLNASGKASTAAFRRDMGAEK